ncbi:MAG: potassium channel family protein [Acidobacteriota bacterium]
MSVLIASTVLVLLVVGIHHEALVVTSWVIERLRGTKRIRVMISVMMTLMAHLVEVAVFALGWQVLLASGAAELRLTDPGYLDLFYFSGATYTSLGYGDVTPVGACRALAAVEAVTGLVLIAWTASYTYYVMKRCWDGDGEPG